MQSDVMTKDGVLQAIDKTLSEYYEVLEGINADEINKVPFENSWTAGQLLRHVEKSIRGMAKAMETQGSMTDQDPAQRIPELKQIFLDFSKKLNAPDFIIPEAGPYDKQESISDLKKAFKNFHESAATAVLNQRIERLPLGPITKLEILHFVLYHTQRHLHQLKKITEAINKISA